MADPVSTMNNPAGSARWPIGGRERIRSVSGPAPLALMALAAIAIAAVGGAAVAVAGLEGFVVSVSLVACVFVLLDFRIGVALLIVLLPVSASHVFPHSIAGIVGLNPLNLLLAGTLGSALLHRDSAAAVVRSASPQLVFLYVLPMIVAGAIGYRHVGEIPAYFSAMELVDFTDAMGYVRDLLVKPLFIVLFAMLAGAAAARSPKLSGFLGPMVVSIWMMCLLTIGFVYLSGASLRELSSATSRNFFLPLGIHANDLGRLYTVAYALLLYTFASTTDHRLRFVLMLSMGAAIVALTLTFSRAAFFGFAVVNVLFLFSRRHLKTLLFGAVLLAALLFALPGAVYDRLATGWGNGLDAITAGRFNEIWLPLLPEVMGSPIYGHGLGAILWADATREGLILQVTHPHNGYLEALLDVGIAGTILVCAFFAWVWKGFRRLARDPALDAAQRGFFEGAAVGLLSFLLAGFFGSSLMPVPEQSYLWLAIGMMMGFRIRQREA